MTSLQDLDPATTALIVIDMQRDFCSPGGYAHQAGLDIARMQAVVGQVKALLVAARAAGLHVFHTREGHLPDLSDCPPAKLARSVALLDSGCVWGGKLTALRLEDRAVFQVPCAGYRAPGGEA